MIAFLKGHIEDKSSDSVLLDVQGVGYKVEISNQTADQLDQAGSEVKLLIYHHITDSDQRLFGFFSGDEKALFEKLITVKGVGPKLGLTILSGLPAGDLISAITSGDAAMLSRVPGIGKKTAERIILELREKLADHIPSGSTVRTPGNAGGGLADEAIQALEALGYKKREAEQAVLKAIKESEKQDPSAIIRMALSMLTKK